MKLHGVRQAGRNIAPEKPGSPQHPESALQYTTLRPEDLAYLYSLYNTYTDADGNQIQLGDLTGEICDIHTEEWAAEKRILQALILDSYTLIARYSSTIAQYGSQLTENQLLALINPLNIWIHSEGNRCNHRKHPKSKR
jgi:hypothetical protein